MWFFKKDVLSKKLRYDNLWIYRLDGEHIIVIAYMLETIFSGVAFAKNATLAGLSNLKISHSSHRQIGKQRRVKFCNKKGFTFITVSPIVFPTIFARYFSPLFFLLFWKIVANILHIEQTRKNISLFFTHRKKRIPNKSVKWVEKFYLMGDNFWKG